MSQEEIISLIRRRDERGAQALLIHYGPLMRYVIAPILRDPQDREECLSEALLRVWDKIASYQEELGSWNAWLTALARNAALDRARQLRRTDATQELSVQLPSPEPTPEQEILRREQRDALHRALGQLSAAERVLFYRKYYYMQSTEQIARELGMTPRAVEGRLYRLKKRLRHAMGGDGHA
ncbi:RNA polymerase sigma factor [Feifania hominis]|uniref:Sigma-70 family RNA polymerase sigma factor n=1 Tax=Feifania hominis TaxID=2763660 RepID=A0A926DE68_9FIRM|nr:sigma-70 family RNA polymerase sigma factor [Feifania hominis]MBC8536186.1 sigma-70 family RNA polymerase sigma factor [Feifania hominis]